MLYIRTVLNGPAPSPALLHRCSSMFVLTYCFTTFDLSYLLCCWPVPLRFKPKINEKLQKLQSLSFDIKSFCNVNK